MISDEHLDEFINLYHQEYGIILDRMQAYEEATKLVELVRILLFDEPLLKKGYK